MSRSRTAVVIPAYRAASTLPALLASIAAGESRPDEVIVADDGTPDFAPCLQEGLNLRFVQLAHLGPVGARNEGWRAATADWVIFVDSDCTVDRGWYGAYQEAMESHPEAALLEGPVEEMFRGRFFRHWAENRRPGRYPTANVAYRRAVLEAVGGLDPTFQWGGLYFREDADLALRALACGPAVWVPEALVHHHGRPISVLRKLREACRYALDPAFVRRHGTRGLAIDRTTVGPIRVVAPRQVSAIGVVALWIAAGFWRPLTLLAVACTLGRAGFIVRHEGLDWGEIGWVTIEQLCEPFVMTAALGAGAVRLLRWPRREVRPDGV